MADALEYADKSVPGYLDPQVPVDPALDPPDIIDRQEAHGPLQVVPSPGDLICDRFLGSGTVPEAVALVGEGRRIAGCEIDAPLVKAARARVSEVLVGQPSGAEMELASV